MEKKDTRAAVSVPSASEVSVRVEALLGQMSLEKKAGQLTQISAGAIMLEPKTEEIIRKGRVVSVLRLIENIKATTSWTEFGKIREP
jgi:hypothetical protein